MASMKKYNLEGQEVGQVAIEDNWLVEKPNKQMIKDYLIALRNNQRQWSANTKVRSEINHTKAKPHPQKGTGRARQGFLGNPQYKGGAIVFGPRPKFDQKVRVNQKEKRAVISQLLAEKFREGKVAILQSEGIDKPHTKTISNFIRSSGLNLSRILFLANIDEDPKKSQKMLKFALSTRNIPKVGFKNAKKVNGHDLALHGQLVIMESALDGILELLKEGTKE